MGNFGHRFTQFILLVLLDLFYIGMTKNYVELTELQIGVIGISFVVLIIPTIRFNFLIPFILVQKSIFLFLHYDTELGVNFLFRLVFWLGILVTYLYLLFVELGEAYYNPNFSPYQIFSDKIELKGVIRLGSSLEPFILTNLSERGFYCRLNDRSKIENKRICGEVYLLNSNYEFEGYIINQSDQGLGVKVVINEIWDKLYNKLERLQYLD